MDADALGCGGCLAGVASGDAFGGDAPAVEDGAGGVGGGARGVNRVARVVVGGVGGVGEEPEFVGRGVLEGAEGVPVALAPDLDPGVVAGLVAPAATDHAGGDADAAAGVDQEDGEAGAGGHADAHGVEGVLVGLVALGGVDDVDALPDAAVEAHGGLEGRLGAGRERLGDGAEDGEPVDGGLAEGGQGGDILAEEGRVIDAPRVGLAVEGLHRGAVGGLEALRPEGEGAERGEEGEEASHAWVAKA